MRLQETSIFFQKNRYRHYYLCDYLPLGSGIDTVSRSLLKFKRGAQPDLDNWIDRSLRGFQATGVALSSDTIIIRALRHRETLPVAEPPSSLDRLGLALARQLQLSYLPELLRKTHPTLLNQSLTRQDRLTQLQNVYQVNPAALPAPTSDPAAHIPEPSPDPAATIPAAKLPAALLLIDDILTTGATILSILQTLRTAFPTCPVTIFTLAKTH